MREFGLTSRQYNAVRFSLDGMESSIIESRPGRISDLEQHKKAVDVKIAKLLKPKPKKAQPCLSAERAGEKSAFKIHNLNRRRETLALKLEALKAEAHPRICFGSRKLFNAQHHLAENGFVGTDAHAQWRAAWQAKRDAQFFVLGSKDETGGCQGCVMTHVSGDRFAVRLRENGNVQRYVWFEVSFPYGSELLAKTLEVGQAMSYRFKRG